MPWPRHWRPAASSWTGSRTPSARSEGTSATVTSRTRRRFTARSIRQLAAAAGFDSVLARSTPPVAHALASAARVMAWQGPWSRGAAGDRLPALGLADEGPPSAGGSGEGSRAPGYLPHHLRQREAADRPAAPGFL